jgi:nitroreductase
MELPSAPAPAACIRRKINFQGRISVELKTRLAQVCAMKRTLSIFVAAFIAGSLLAQSIALPVPQKTGGMPLMDTLAKRATSRTFDSKELSPQQLSSLLWAAFGINRPDGKRTAPSAMNFQETDIYVLLKQGAYVYSARSNELDLVVAEDIRALGGTQAFVTNAPVTLVFVADLSKMGKGSDENKKNTANIDVGYISQNVYLFCASEGLVTGARGSVDRATLGPRLKLRPEQMIILAQSAGYPKP